MSTPVPASPNAVPAALGDRLVETLRRAVPLLPEHMRHDVAMLLSPESLAMTAGVLGAWAASHAVGVGAIVDLGLIALGVITLGTMVADVAAAVSRAVQKSATATRPADLDAAAADLAAAITLLGTALFTTLVMKTAAKRGIPGRAKAIPKESPRYYAMTAEEWLYKIGFRRMAPQNVKSTTHAIEFFEHHKVAPNDAAAWLKAMDLSRPVSWAGFDKGAEIVGYMKLAKPGAAARLKANPAELQAILKAPTEHVSIGSFFTKGGTPTQRLGVLDDDRIFFRFRVRHPVEALEATAGPARDVWTVGSRLKDSAPAHIRQLHERRMALPRDQRASISIDPLWYEGSGVAGGSTQYLIPDAWKLVKSGDLEIVQIGDNILPKTTTLTMPAFKRP